MMDSHYQKCRHPERSLARALCAKRSRRTCGCFSPFSAPIGNGQFDDSGRITPGGETGCIMNLKDVIEGMRGRSYSSGEFQLPRGESINSLARENQVPDDRWLYIISRSMTVNAPIYCATSP